MRAKSAEPMYAERNVSIVCDLEMGVPKATVARKYGLCRQRIATIYQDEMFNRRLWVRGTSEDEALRRLLPALDAVADLSRAAT